MRGFSAWLDSRQETFGKLVALEDKKSRTLFQSFTSSEYCPQAAGCLKTVINGLLFSRAVLIQAEE